MSNRYAYSHDDENYEGEFSTPQDAIRAAYEEAAESCAEGEPAGLRIGVVGHISGSALAAAGADVVINDPHPSIEDISERMFDDLRKRLGEAFRDWCETHGLVTEWQGITRTVAIAFDVDPEVDSATLAAALAAYDTLPAEVKLP